jgi:hypothetical protein
MTGLGRECSLPLDLLNARSESAIPRSKGSGLHLSVKQHLFDIASDMPSRIQGTLLLVGAFPARQNALIFAHNSNELSRTFSVLGNLSHSVRASGSIS